MKTNLLVALGLLALAGTLSAQTPTTAWQVAKGSPELGGSGVPDDFPGGRLMGNATFSPNN